MGMAPARAPPSQRGTTARPRGALHQLNFDEGVSGVSAVGTRGVDTVKAIYCTAFFMYF